ncbi:MAG: hypothetical protein JSR45_04405 [Proteobacteria bacterium]|nr:hypothetical protein [Pseudomonadota bacterium]
MRLSALLIAVGVCAMAAPAFAGDVKCLWNAPVQAKRDAVLTGALSDPQAAANLETFLADAPEAQIRKVCGLTDETLKPAVTALSGYLYETASSRWLAASKIATSAQLDAGWTGLDAGLRSSVLANAGAFSNDPLPPEAFAQFLTHTGVAALSPTGDMSDRAHTTALLYFLGRAIRTANEAKY